MNHHKHCRVKGCEQKLYAASYCKTHYKHDISKEIFKDYNMGFAYQREFVKSTKHTPSPLLRVRQVELRKNKGQVRLPLYWYEPVEGGETL